MTATPETSLHTVCASCGGVNRIDGARLTASPASAKCGRCRELLLSSAPVAITGEAFDAFVSRSDIPILVDFWAPWCGPCRSLAPVLERVASEVSPEIRVVKVNIDEAPQLAERLRISSIPTLAVFRRGRELGRNVGGMPQAALTQWVRNSANQG